MEELLGLLDRLTVILGEMTAVQKDVAASVHTSGRVHEKRTGVVAQPAQY